MGLGSFLYFEPRTKRRKKNLILFAVRDGLCGQVFSGWYTERRFIDPIER